METEFLLDLRKVKGISYYQFGTDITDILFDDVKNIYIKRSRKTNRIRYIYYRDDLLLTLKPNNGFFTLSIFSAKKILENSKIPRLRVIVLNDISEFIKKGRNVFCKHVLDIDNNLRPFDEVIAVNEDDELLAVGRLKIPVPYIKSFSSGVAINIRKGIYKSKI
ncbi:MAG: PUA domain-containing protein [Promethearchaeota archaeon]